MGSLATCTGTPRRSSLPTPRCCAVYSTYGHRTYSSCFLCKPFSRSVNFDLAPVDLTLTVRNTIEALVRVDIPLVFAVSPHAVSTAAWTPLLDGYIEHPAATTLVPFGNDLRPRREPLLLYFSLTEYFTAESPNRCIAAMTHNYVPTPKSWCGAVLVLKLAASQHVDFVDVQRRDKKDIRGYFARLR